MNNPIAVTHGATGGDIEWVTEAAKTYSITLTFDVATFTFNIPNEVNSQITTRVYNGSLPGPTLRFQRGNQYQVTLINTLGAEDSTNPTQDNVPKDINTTNIHVHGLHIGGMVPGDNVFMSIGPGDQHTYVYNIPCSHSGGTFFYHPHHHGSTEYQVGHGAGGVLIIDDDPIEGLPTWYTSMNELIFFITHVDIPKLTNRWKHNVNNPLLVDNVWERTPADNSRNDEKTNLYLVNGQFKPNICVTAGEWIKLRFAHIEIDSPRLYYIGTGSDGCMVKLLARDGVIVHGSNNQAPRDVSNVIWLTQSSRADVAVYCPGHASNDITYNIYSGHNGNQQEEIIATLQVIGQPITAPELTPFTPIRPNYLTNLIDYTGAFQQYNNNDFWDNVRITGSSVAGNTFVDETNYLQNIAINSVNEWRITKGTVGGVHPFHMHVNHFQMVQNNLANDANRDTNYDPPTGYHEIGDFYDTLYGEGHIRFKTDLWAGTVAFHCHIPRHGDQGAIGTVNIVDGCDNSYGNIGAADSCTYVDTCSSTYAPSNPSVSPTNSPTIPTISATDAPTYDPNHKPNFFIFVADDLSFLHEWDETIPPNGPFGDGNTVNYFSGTRSDGSSLTPTIDLLRDEGVIFPRIWSAGPKCAPARYALLTGRQTSRSKWAQFKTVDGSSLNPPGSEGTTITVPYSKLYDTDNHENIAYILQNELSTPKPYYTAAIGKWHVMSSSDDQFGCSDLNTQSNGNKYSLCTEWIKDNQGFDFVDGWYDGNIDATANYGHNPEWMVHKTKEAISNAQTADNPFFIYFAATLTHSPDVYTSLSNSNGINKTPAGSVSNLNHGMTSRSTLKDIVDNASGGAPDKAAGYIWIDEQLKAIISHLRDIGELDYTFFIFTNDHGMGAKASLYEQGTRVLQFVRYPPKFGTSQTILPNDFIVSHLDITAQYLIWLVMMQFQMNIL
eukprot:61396_1